MLAATLAEAMRRIDPALECYGIGAERMEAAGVTLTERTSGWAGMGPLEAIGRILPLYVAAWRLLFRLFRDRPALVVFVDFGAFNLRVAQALRRYGYRGAMLYYFPPGAWFDRRSQARAVAGCSDPLVPFAHQRDFYRSLGLPVAYFGHPLASLIEARAPRPPAPQDGGVVALLPGSRRREIVLHSARLFAACELLRARRPHLDVLVSAADDECERLLREEMRRTGFEAKIVRGSRDALDAADAAFIASGTAVLEATLRETPSVALYVVTPSEVKIARRIWPHRFITLPNILLGREVVRELLQDEATPEALAAALEPLLENPAPAVGALREVRAALGPPDALELCAAYALELARGGAA
jgi:lipid-A-disaccharide synthase